MKALKALFAWACEEKPDIVSHNTTLGVRKITYATDGHHSWTPEEIAQYRQRHPLGTKARFALDLLLYTGGRREDAVRLGPQHVRNGRVKFRQAKNEHRNPIDIGAISIAVVSSASDPSRCRPLVREHKLKVAMN